MKKIKFFAIIISVCFVIQISYAATTVTVIRTPPPCTTAIQNAIDSGADKVVIPYDGSTWFTGPLFLASDQELYLESGVHLSSYPNLYNDPNACLLSAKNRNNVKITGYGAVLKMRPWEYSSIEGGKEYRHGITIQSSSNVIIKGVKILTTGGDGIFVGRTPGDITPSSVIRIEDVEIDQAIRNGISLVSVDTITIKNCILRNAGKYQQWNPEHAALAPAGPWAGIDIEPNHTYEKSKEILIYNCDFYDNINFGIVANFNKLDSTSDDISFQYQYCNINNSYYGLYFDRLNSSAIGGSFYMCQMTINNAAVGITFRAWIDGSVDTHLTSSVLNNCTDNPHWGAIRFMGDNAGYHSGGVWLDNLYFTGLKTGREHMVSIEGTSSSDTINNVYGTLKRDETNYHVDYFNSYYSNIDLQLINY